MKVLGFAGSPRVDGNSDLLLKQVLDGAQKQGAEVERVYLNKLDIGACQACKACHTSAASFCIYADDMAPWYDKLLVADAWVLATPVYWWGPSAQLKLFVDRWYALMPVRQQLVDKKTALVVTMADNEPKTANPTVAMFEDAFSYLNMNFIDKLIVTASDKGAVKNDSNALMQAYQLGLKLASK